MVMFMFMFFHEQISTRGNLQANMFSVLLSYSFIMSTHIRCLRNVHPPKLFLGRFLYVFVSGLLSVCMARYPDISIVSGLLSVCMARYPDISIVPAHNKLTCGVSEKRTEQFIKLEIFFQ